MNIHKIVLPTPFPVGDVNVFLVKGEALTLFDAGPKTTEAYETLKTGIRAAGYEMKDIDQVILTHQHPDHAGWIDAFPKANILAHEYVDHWLRQKPEFLEYRDQFYQYHMIRQAVPERYIEKMLQIRGELELLGTTPLTHFIQDGDEMPGHPGLKAHYTPGHAQSHLIFVDEKTNTAIGGDLLLETISSNPLIEPPIDLSMDRPKTLLQYHQSLTLLKDLNVSKLYTGHGNEIENVNELIDFRIKRDHKRAKQAYDILSEPKTVYEVTQKLYASLYKSELGLTLSKTIGELDYLEQEGFVKVELVGDVLIYSRT